MSRKCIWRLSCTYVRVTRVMRSVTFVFFVTHDVTICSRSQDNVLNYYTFSKNAGMSPRVLSVWGHPNV